MRRPIVAVVSLIVVLVIGFFVFWQLAPATAPDLGDEAPVEQVVEVGSSQPNMSFDVTVSGAINIGETQGITDANLMEARDDRPERREIWIDLAGDWLVVIAFPVDASITTYPFEATNADDEITAYIIAPPESVAPDALAFGENATGSITITAIEEDRISGEFSFTASASDETEVEVEGYFTNIIIRD